MIYFDNGATSLPKPAGVLQAAVKAAALGNPGRGGHRLALEGAKLLYGARERLALHFAVPAPENVCFFSGATEALCRVIKSLVPAEGTILISDMEHNAVRRPALAVGRKGARLLFFKGYGSKEDILSSFAEMLKRKPDLAVFIHTSNICPQTLPVKDLCALCRKNGVLSLVDCAQAGGHLPLSLEELQADGIVLPGHKGLFGLQGAGALLCSDRMKGALEQAQTIVEGGSGTHSLEEEMPPLLPERMEAGTLGLPAIAALAEGVRYISCIGYEEIGERLVRLYKRCGEGLSVIHGIRLCAPLSKGAGPLLFDTDLAENAELAGALSDRGICVREGLHCAPLAHGTVGTGKRGGIRVSLSFLNTEKETDVFLKVLQREMKTLR